MADNTYTDNNTYVDNDATVNRNDLRNNEEPATRHDINEGATIGAVGGGIVGAIAGGIPTGAAIGGAAGGPVGGVIGAVVGAVVGGAASAGAVDVVDKHDNDYDRQVAKGEVDNDTTGRYNDSAYATTTATPSTYASAGNLTDTGVATGSSYDQGAYVPVRNSDVDDTEVDSVTNADPRYRTTTSNI